MIDENTREELIGAVSSAVARNPEAQMWVPEFENSFESLLDFCDVGYGEKPIYYDNEYNREKPISDLLIEEYISFDSGVGGSTSDYVAWDIIKVLDVRGAYLIPEDVGGIMERISDEIEAHATYPEREFGRLADAGIYAD